MSTNKKLRLIKLLISAMFGISLSLPMACSENPAATPGEESALKIVGGSIPAQGTPTRASTVALVKNDRGALSSLCSGVLVAPRLVLTAAHCVESSKTKLSVFFGENDSDPKGRLVEIEKSLTYKKDGSRFFPNFDIAWVKLAADAPAPWKPIELLRSSSVLQGLEGQTEGILLAGFGRTASVCRDANCMGKLLEVKTHLKHFFNEAHFVNLLVIGPNPNHGTCNGDSGGPAFIQHEGRWLLAGILNGKSPLLNSTNLWENGVCESGEAIYNFTGAYVDWIESTSGIHLGFDETKNPRGSDPIPLQNLSTLAAEPTLEQFLSFNNHNETIWATVETLVNEFKDPSRRLGATVDELVTKPELAASVMRRWTEFSHLGVSFDFTVALQKANQISDIRPLSELTSLKKLSLDSNKIDNTSPLRQLVNLQELTLRNNYDLSQKTKVPWDFAFLGSLSNLKRLDLSNNSENIPLYSIAWNRLSKLEELELSDNGKGLDLSAIPWSRLKNLKTLTIRNSQLLRIDALAQATSLETLDLSRNVIESIAALKSLKNLSYLDVSMNRISDFSPLSNLTKLKNLKALSNVQYVEYCPHGASCVYSPASFTDFESYCKFAFTLSTEDLSHWSGGATVMRLIQIAKVNPTRMDSCEQAQDALSKMTRIDLSGGPQVAKIEDLSPLNPLTQLEELVLSNNDLRDVRPLAGLVNLKFLDLSMNYVENLEPLSELWRLETLDLDGNLVTSLDTMRNIGGLEVFVRNNPIRSNECPIPFGDCHFDDPSSIHYP